MYPLPESLAGAQGVCGSCGAGIVAPATRDVGSGRAASAGQCTECKSFHPAGKLIKSPPAHLCHPCFAKSERPERLVDTAPGAPVSGARGALKLAYAVAGVVLVAFPLLIVFANRHGRVRRPDSAAITVAPTRAAEQAAPAAAILPSPAAVAEPLPSSVALSSVTPNAHVTLPTAIKLAPTFSSPPGAVTRVDFYDGKTPIGSATTQPFVLTWKPTDEGRYSLTARAVDAAGHVVTSPAVPLTLHLSTNKAPTVEMKQPNRGKPLTGSQDHLDLAAVAHDSDGFVARVEFFANGEKLGSAKPNDWAGAGEPVRFQWRNLKPGHYTLTAKAIDDSGAAATSEPVELTVNRRPLALRISSPASGTQVQLPRERVEIVAEVQNPDAKTTRVEFYDADRLLGVATAKPFKFAGKELQPGKHTLLAKAFSDDDATAASSPVNVTVKKAPNKPPTVALREPGNERAFTLPAEIPVLAEARDADGQVTRVELFANGKPLARPTTAPFRTVWTPTKPGRYALVAKAYDNESASRESQPMYVNVRRSPDKPPVVTLSPVGIDSTIEIKPDLRLGATASDADGSVAKVEFFANGTKLGEVREAPFTLAWPNPTPGRYTLKAKATDNEGATSTSSEVTVRLTVASDDDVE